MTSSKKKWWGKRGQVEDILVYGVILFVMAVTILIGYRILKDVNTNFQDSPQISTQAKTNLNSFTNKFSTIFDAVYIFALVIAAVVLIVSVFLLDTHPLLFVLSLPAFLVVLFVNVILANALDDIGNTSGFVALYAEFEMMQFVASHWIALMSIVGFVTLTVFYAKRSGSS